LEPTLLIISSWIILLILAIRDRNSYIETISIQVFKVFKIEIVKAEKRKPPVTARRSSNTIIQ